MGSIRAPAANNDIGPLGLGPEYVIVKSAESQPAVQRSKGLNDPWSSYFESELNLDDGIIDLKADHFKVGVSATVNEPGKTYITCVQRRRRHRRP